MSDVIRRAIVDLSIRVANPNLKLPDLTPAIKQQEALAESIKKGEAATRKADATTKESTKTADVWTAGMEKINEAWSKSEKGRDRWAEGLARLKGQQDAGAIANERLAASYVKVGHATLGVAKGVAFMAAGQSDALSKALPYLFMLEGMYAVSKNLEKAKKELAKAEALYTAATAAGATATGRLAAATTLLYASVAPLLLPLAAIAVIIGGLISIYDSLTESTEEAAEAEKKHREQVESGTAALSAANERRKIALDSDLDRIDNLSTLAEKEDALREKLQSRGQTEAEVEALRKSAAKSGEPEFADQMLQAAVDHVNSQRAAAEKLLDVEREQLEAGKKKNDDLIETIKLRQREVDKAREALKVEQDKSRTLRAGIGALSVGERRGLERAVGSAEAGTLTAKQAKILQERGGEAGQTIAEKFFEKLDQGLGSRLEKIIGDPLKKAQDELERRQKLLGDSTGGQTAAAKIRELEQTNEELTAAFNEMQGELLEKVRFFIDELKGLQIEQSKQRQAAQAANRKTA